MVFRFFGRENISIADLSALAADLPTLLGVTTGIAVLAGLICMVLHLFSKTKYPRTRHFADAHNGPPAMFASDTGTHDGTPSIDVLFFNIFLFYRRNSFDNTIQSTIIEIEPALIGFDWILHTSLIRCPPQRSQRVAVSTRCRTFSRHIAILISFKRAQRPNIPISETLSFQ